MNVKTWRGELFSDYELSQRVADCFSNGGPEEGHLEADKLLCEILAELGYPMVVAEFEKGSKWYA